MASRTSREEQLIWKKIIEDQPQSGLTVQKWCKQHRLSHNAFYYWRKKLGLSKRLGCLEFKEVTDEHSDRIILDFFGARVVLQKDFNPALLKELLRAIKTC